MVFKCLPAHLQLPNTKRQRPFEREPKDSRGERSKCIHEAQTEVTREYVKRLMDEIVKLREGLANSKHENAVVQNDNVLLKLK